REFVSDLFHRQSVDPRLSRGEALRQAMTAMIDGGGYLDTTDRMLFSYAHPHAGSGTRQEAAKPSVNRRARGRRNADRRAQCLAELLNPVGAPTDRLAPDVAAEHQRSPHRQRIG